MTTYKHQLNPGKKIQSVLTTSPNLKQTDGSKPGVVFIISASVLSTTSYIYGYTNHITNIII